MKLFQGFMRTIVAVLDAALSLLIHGLLDLLAGPAPNDVSLTLWSILSTIGIFVLNFLLSKVGKATPISVPTAAEVEVRAVLRRHEL